MIIPVQWFLLSEVKLKRDLETEKNIGAVQQG